MQGWFIQTSEADADYFFSFSNQTGGQPLLMGSRISDLVIWVVLWRSYVQKTLACQCIREELVERIFWQVSRLVSFWMACLQKFTDRSTGSSIASQKGLTQPKTTPRRAVYINSIISGLRIIQAIQASFRSWRSTCRRIYLSRVGSASLWGLCSCHLDQFSWLNWLPTSYGQARCEIN